MNVGNRRETSGVASSDLDSSTSGCSTGDEDADRNYGTEGTTDGLHLEARFRKVIESAMRK